MNYNQFLNYVKENILAELEFYDSANVTISKVTKNNSVTLDGLCIRRNEDTISPTIYLNRYYEQYIEGRPLKTILYEIAQKHMERTNNIHLDTTDILNFNEIKNGIVVRLVNYERNETLLHDCPYIPFHDLAITFRWLAHQDSDGIASAIISNREFEAWNITTQELMNIALSNTQSLFPAHIQNIRQLLSEYLDEDALCGSENDMNLYVLTNAQEINGATCMLYDEILDRFARQIDSDLYILPSSIHEVILVPAKDVTDNYDMNQMVCDANNSVVALMDILSDSVYYYSKENHNLQILSA